MISNIVPPHKIPKGMYDSGNGYYEPVKRVIYTYEMKFFRTAGMNHDDTLITPILGHVQVVA
jgi:hypothetical protein